MTDAPVYLSDIAPRPKALTVWERQRNRKEVHWFVECFAEALGVFFYTYGGVGSTVPFVVGNILKISGLSSILQIGLGYMGGILLAIVICGPTSGAHFSPCVTVVYVLFRGFPPIKGLRYIVAQIFGAYVACALTYVQYGVLLHECEVALTAVGKLHEIQFTPNGPAGIFALYILPGQTLGRVFLNEFVVAVFVGLTIWTAIDPSNPLVPPAFSPVIVAFAYATAIWGFSVSGIALNTARDLGGRLFAMSVWGTEAAGGKYAAIAALTNIPATIVAVLIYEIFLKDSDRVIPRASLEFISGHLNHRRFRAEAEAKGQTPGFAGHTTRSEMQDSSDKSLAYEHKERASSSAA